MTDGETNASLRKGDDVETITIERAAELLADRRAAGPATKKKAAKKATAKKTTAKKTAAKKATGEEGDGQATLRSRAGALAADGEEPPEGQQRACRRPAADRPRAVRRRTRR